MGNLGGFASPNLIGQIHAATGDFVGGLAAMAVILCGGGLLALRARHERPPAS